MIQQIATSDYNKINSASSKNIKRMKRQTINGDEMFAIRKTNKGSVPRTRKGIL